MRFSIVLGEPERVEEMAVLFPRLADIPLTPKRRPEQLWAGDVALLREWAAGERPEVFVLTAVGDDEDAAVLGVAMVSMREEALSHEPSAHLETLVVGKAAEGQGIGQGLVEAAEAEVRKRGGLSMTLHMLVTNERARRVYEKVGFEVELLRLIKHFG